MTFAFWPRPGSEGQIFQGLSSLAGRAPAPHSGTQGSRSVKCKWRKEEDGMKALQFEMTRTRASRRAEEKSRRLAAGDAERRVTISVTVGPRGKPRKGNLMEDLAPTAPGPHLPETPNPQSRRVVRSCVLWSARSCTLPSRLVQQTITSKWGHQATSLTK